MMRSTWPCTSNKPPGPSPTLHRREGQDRMKGKRNGKQPPQPKLKNQIKVSHNTFLRIQERAEPIVDNGNDVITRVFKEANEMRRIDPENPEYWKPRKLRSGARKRGTSPPTIQREESPITEPLNYMTRPVPETNLLAEIQRDTPRMVDTLRLNYERRATTRLPGTKPPPVMPARERRVTTPKTTKAIKSPEYQIPTLRALSKLPTRKGNGKANNKSHSTADGTRLYSRRPRQARHQSYLEAPGPAGPQNTRNRRHDPEDREISDMEHHRRGTREAQTSNKVDTGKPNSADTTGVQGIRAGHPLLNF